MIGPFTFFFLSTLALLAGFSVARRIVYPKRTERLLAGMMIASGLMLAVIHTLGFLQVLRPVTLGIAALATFGAALGLSSINAPAGHVRECLRDLALLFVLPAEALKVTAQAKSFAFLAALAALGVLAYTGWLSYLAPSDGWDGIAYHETMVAYAIQNHGYALAATPPNYVHVNTFPRNCEMTNLWFVIFWDRRLIDIVNNAYSVPLAFALFSIVRRYSAGVVDAIGWTACMILVPGYYLQLHSNYIDIHAASFYFGGLALGTRPELRIRDSIPAALCFGLLLGAKSFALAWTPVLCAVTFALLLWRHARKRPRAVLAATLAAVTLLMAFGAPIYVRNWLVYHNPVHPYRYDPTTHKLQSSDIGGTEFNRPLKPTVLDMIAPPKPGYDYVDTRQFGYGLALPFFTAPVALVALAACLFALARNLALRLTGGTPDGVIFNLVLTVFPPLTTFFYTPALWLPRYNYPLIGGIFVLVAWFFARAQRLAEGTIALNAVTGMMWMYWAVPAWLVTFDEARRLAYMPAQERSLQTTIGWSIGRDTARARERLGASDLVVYTDDIEFPAVLWNEHFSNRVLYVPLAPGQAMLGRLSDLNAKWFITSRLASFFDAQPGWRRVGPVSGRPVYAYERVN